MAINGVKDLIYEYVREQILIGELKAKDKISEGTIGEQFGVSKTIVREAFAKLKDKGWIYSVEKSGTYVAPVDVNAILENYEARIRLEPVVLAMAYPFLTKEDIAQMRELLKRMSSGNRSEYIEAETEQHLLFIQKTNNRYVIDFFTEMHEGMMRAASRTSAGSGQRSKASVREWTQVIDLLDEGDILMASHYLEAHIIGSYRSFCETLQCQEKAHSSKEP